MRYGCALLSIPDVLTNVDTFLQTMQAVNKKMDPQKTLKTMQDFQKENMKMGMTEEMSKDTLEHAHTHTLSVSSGMYWAAQTRFPGCMSMVGAVVQH